MLLHVFAADIGTLLILLGVPLLAKCDRTLDATAYGNITGMVCVFIKRLDVLTTQLVVSLPDLLSLSHLVICRIHLYYRKFELSSLSI